MDEVVRNILDLAKQNLVKDGWLLPVGFALKDGKVFPPMPLTAQAPEGVPLDDKAYNVVRLASMAAFLGADRILMVWDAAMRSYPQGTDMKSLESDEYERPLLYPKSMRTEVLIVLSARLPDGEETMDAMPYKGGDGEPVVWLDNEMPEGIEGFKSRFTDLARKAYAKALEAKGE